MTLRLPLTFLTLFVGLATTGQGLVTLYDEGENVVNGTVIYKSSSPSNVRDTVSLATVVVGTADRDVMVRRYEVWPVENSRNMFCWGVCYTSALAGANPVWVSPFPETLSEDEYYTGFHAYYEPTGMTGTARFRFVFYDNNNPDGADSSWVDIDFGGAVGMVEPSVLNAELVIGPNPTAGNDIVVKYALGDLGQGTEITLFNVVGEKVRRRSLSATQGQVVIPGTGLESGIYFANIMRNGRILATRRVVITR